MEKSKELIDLINNLITQRNEVSITAMKIIQQSKIDYSHLKGKSVKVCGHKAWNIGIIRDFTLKSGKALEDFYLNVDIIGPDRSILTFGLDEVELLEN